MRATRIVVTFSRWAALTALTLSMDLAAIAAQLPADPAAFNQNVGAFVKQNCAVCHNEQLKTGGLVLTKYHDTASLVRDRQVWEKVVARVRAGEMPPRACRARIRNRSPP